MKHWQRWIGTHSKLNGHHGGSSYESVLDARQIANVKSCVLIRAAQSLRIEGSDVSVKTVSIAELPPMYQNTGVCANNL